jgi:hypothetical protein
VRVPAGLSQAGFRNYLAALQQPHERRVSAEIQTLGGTLLRSLTLNVLDGQVTVDTTAEVSRMLSLTFLDPSQSLQFEPDSPGDAPLHRSRRIQVHYAIRVPALSDWVSCPVFTGPLWDFDRQGALVSITAHGMDRQGLGNRWSPRSFAKKSKKTTAIRALLSDIGFTRMSVPDLPATFPNRFSIGRMDQPWVKAKSIARSMNRHLFVDAAGIPRLRAYPKRAAFTFDAALLSEPFVNRGAPTVNIVEVIGAKPKGSKTRVSAVAALPDGNPNSPQSLAMTAGHPLYLGYKEENDHIKTKAGCFTIARRIRDEKAQTSAEIGWDSLPIVCLEEMDMVVAVSESGPFTTRAQQWTIPLGGSAPGGTNGPPMTVGSIRRTTAAKHGH